MDVDAGGCCKEGVSEAREWLTIEAPVLLLSFVLSVLIMFTVRVHRTVSQLLLLFICVFRLEDAILPRNRDPRERETKESKAQLEDEPS